jgi:tetratricopeptide (TPR) repeat protein
MALGGSMLGLCIGLVLAFLISGAHVPARHSCLRALMACYGLAPLDYVRFLDYCDERLILRKVGGSYCFSHRLLLDYFASLPVLPAEAGRLDHATEMIKSRQRLLAVGIFGRQAIHFSIAMLLLAQGELRAAEKHLQESRSLHRNDAFEENTLLGVLAWQQGQRDAAGLCFTAALNIYETSKQINREKSRILEYRAMALLGLGRIDAAEASLQKAIASSELHLNEIDDQHDHLLPWQMLEEPNPAPAGLDRLMALLPER